MRRSRHGTVPQLLVKNPRSFLKLVHRRNTKRHPDRQQKQAKSELQADLMHNEQQNLLTTFRSRTHHLHHHHHHADGTNSPV
jgi:hypothetical protein